MPFYKSVHGELVELPKRTKAVVIPGWEDYKFHAHRQIDPQVDPEKELKTPPMVWCLYTEKGKSVLWGDALAQTVEGARDMFAPFDREKLISLLELA